jgi:hypothetical protein
MVTGALALPSDGPFPKAASVSSTDKDREAPVAPEPVEITSSRIATGAAHRSRLPRTRSVSGAAKEFSLASRRALCTTEPSQNVIDMLAKLTINFFCVNPALFVDHGVTHLGHSHLFAAPVWDQALYAPPLAHSSRGREEMRKRQ